jgi:hypothetical protein
MIRTFFFLLSALLAGHVAVGQDQFWEQVPGRASGIAIGAEGTVWILDTAHSAYHVARLDDTGWVQLAPQGLRAVRLTVDFRGHAWIVTDRNQPYRFSEGRYFRVTGTLTDISAGPTGAVLGIGTDAKAGGYGVWHFNGVGWNQTNGVAGVRIAVDPMGLFWALDTGHNIFRYSTGVFDLVPGQAEAISIGAEGTVWIVQPDGTLARLDGDRWAAVAFRARAVDIAVGPDGRPWVVDADGQIWRAAGEISGE